MKVIHILKIETGTDNACQVESPSRGIFALQGILSIFENISGKSDRRDGKNVLRVCRFTGDKPELGSGNSIHRNSEPP